ncbi:MAG: GspH/FimT family pseudopilin [Neptuniibacter sp.]
MLHREKGFTLLELMVALTVLAILLGIGVPSFNSFVESSRLRSAVHEINSAVYLARSEAVTRRQDAAACRANTTNTACDFGNDWSQGWLVVLLNGADLETAADVDVVRIWDEVEVTASGAINGFVFDRLGAADAAVSLDIQNDTDNRCISVNISGRVLVQEQACP